MSSLWMENVKLKDYERLTGNHKTDVLIIGGGLFGILTAHMLSKENVDYKLVEAGKLCGGNTGRTTAKITAQHGLIYHKILKEYGLEKARMYLEANNLALLKYKELSEGIKCHFEEKDSFVYSVEDRRELENEIRALEKTGCASEFAENLPLPFPVKGAVKMSGQAQFNPLEFVSGILEGLGNIYENTRVTELSGHTAVTDKGKIKAEKIVIATHYPFIDSSGLYFMKLYQDRSYVTALEGCPRYDGMYVEAHSKAPSFRSYEDFMIMGGGSHRTGKKGCAFKYLKEKTALYFPGAKEKYHWAAQDCMSLDGIPYIGEYSSVLPYVYTASGFNKWGMTSSMAAAMIITDMILGRENDFAPVFSPLRSIFKPQLAVNIAESAVNLLTFSKKRCSHMGCALKWNPYEHTWDCPCHGSRFDKTGKILDNPANKKI